MGPASRFACAGRRPVELVCRHCERNEAIHGTSATKLDCFAALAITGLATAGKHTQLSFPDVLLHIVDAPLGAGPESITTNGGYGFRARRCASPRNDGWGWVGLSRRQRRICFVHAVRRIKVVAAVIGVLPANAGTHTPCRLC